LSWAARDENVVLTKHPARIGFTSRYLTAIVFILIAVFTLYLFRHHPPLGLYSTSSAAISIGAGSYYVWWPSVILLIFALLIILLTESHRRATRYTITSKRVAIESGLLSKSIKEASLAQIQDVVVHQSALQRLLNVGDLEVRTEIGSQGVIWLWDVPKPREFERSVFNR
jgi:membrane protein YdbS with pleckstrin-like domain